MIKHPIRDLEIRAFSNPEHGWVAQFGDGRAFPIIFRAQSETRVRSKADLFRVDVINKHEAAYIARKKAATTMLSMRPGLPSLLSGVRSRVVSVYGRSPRGVP